MVTLTPCSPQAETYVNGQRLSETTLLQHGCVIRFGRNAYQFRFIDPPSEFRTRPASTALNYEKFTGQQPQPPRAVSTTPSAVAPPPGTDPILPAVLELPEEVEDAFLHALIPNLDTRQIVFRLAPTYSLYLMARYRASTHFRPELNPMERAQRLTLTLSRVGAMMQAIVQERYADPPSLAFWMANASELLHFLKSDRHICAFSLDGQDLLAEAVQIAFRNASVCLTSELLQSMPPMLSPPTDQDRRSRDGPSPVRLVIDDGFVATLPGQRGPDDPVVFPTVSRPQRRTFQPARWAGLAPFARLGFPPPPTASGGQFVFPPMGTGLEQTTETVGSLGRTAGT